MIPLALALMLLAPALPDTVRFGPFGRVTVYQPAAEPTGVVLFISGDGGWNLGVVGMAEQLARRDLLVVGIDITRFMRALDRGAATCSYPAGDLENLAHFIERRAGLPRYLAPVLVGYSSGATLVYAALAQAPVGTFAGAVSLGFCPDLPLEHPLCRGRGLEMTPVRQRGIGRGYRFGPLSSAALPWIVLHGDQDQVCSSETARAFVARVPQARFVTLPQVGHGFGVTSRWLPQFTAAVAELAKPPTTPPRHGAIADLPLIELPASRRGEPDDRLAIIVSGDGGWASLDRDVGETLAARGISVIGWNSLQYFWTKRTPDAAGADLARIAQHYLTAWGKTKLLLIGYSRGAEVLPFMAARLPENLRRAVVEVALIAPGRSANFTWHAADLLFQVHHADDLPLAPEIQRLKGLAVLCLYGTDDAESVCPDVSRTGVRSIALPGGHHFGGRYQTLAGIILEGL